MTGTCPHCRAARPEAAQRCPACGEPLTPEARRARAEAFAAGGWTAWAQADRNAEEVPT